MARLFTTLTTLLLCLLTATALPLPNNNPASGIISRIVHLLQGAQATTVPPPSTLPGPLPGLTLKYVALGLGTQNYSCASATAVPVALGARASLYDTTDAAVALAHSAVSANNKAMSLGTCTADQRNTAGPLQQIGVHFFDAAGTPTFDLAAEGMLLKAKKMGAADAPGDACKGRDGGAAVPWLDLQDDGTGRSRGLGQVFRVETAGGAAPATCGGMGATFERDYAALYYLYG